MSEESDKQINTRDFATRIRLGAAELAAQRDQAAQQAAAEAPKTFAQRLHEADPNAQTTGKFLESDRPLSTAENLAEQLAKLNK